MTEPVNHKLTDGDKDYPARRSLEDRRPSPSSCEDRDRLSQGTPKSMPNNSGRWSNIRWSMPCDSDADNGRHNSVKESDTRASNDARPLATVTCAQSGVDSTDSDDTTLHIRSVLGFCNHTVTYDCPKQGTKRYSTAITQPNRLGSSTDHQRFPAEVPATKLEKHRQCRPTNKHLNDNQQGHDLVAEGNYLRRYRIGETSPSRDTSKLWKTASESACKSSSSSTRQCRTNHTVNVQNADRVNQQHRTHYRCHPDDKTYARASRHAISNACKSVNDRQSGGASHEHNARRSASKSNLRTAARTASISPVRCCRCNREPRPIYITTVNGRARNAQDDGSASDTTEEDYRTCRSSVVASELVKDNDDDVTSSSVQSDDGYTTDISAECFQRRRQSIMRKVGSCQNVLLRRQPI